MLLAHITLLVVTMGSIQQAKRAQRSSSQNVNENHVVQFILDERQVQLQLELQQLDD